MIQKITHITSKVAHFYNDTKYIQWEWVRDNALMPIVMMLATGFIGAILARLLPVQVP